ncbi:hypothetical protein ACJX0J_022587, partial [Zea mays]
TLGAAAPPRFAAGSSSSHGDHGQLRRRRGHSWRRFWSAARVCSVSVRRVSGILLRAVLEREESPGASSQVPNRPPPSSCQERARRLPCDCERVWPNLQVSHGKATTGDRGQCRAVQGGRHQEVQGHPQPEHPAAVDRFPAPGRPLPHQGLDVVGDEEHGGSALPASAACRAHSGDAVVRRHTGGEHRRLPGPGLRPLLPALAPDGHRHHRQDGLRHRVRPVQERRRHRQQQQRVPRRRRGRGRRQGIPQGVQAVHGVRQDGPDELSVHHPRPLPPVRPDAVQAPAAAGARHGGLQDGPERAPPLLPHRRHHSRPPAGPGHAPALRPRRRPRPRPAGLHRGAAGCDGERRRRRRRCRCQQGLRAGGQARARAGVRAPHRRHQDHGVHAVVGGVPGLVPPARGGQAAAGVGRLRAAPRARARAGRRRAPERVPLPRPGHQGGHAVLRRLAAHRQADLRARGDRGLRSPQ